MLDLTAGHPRVRGWVTLVGHDLMSDELVVGASELAREQRHRADVPPLADRRRRRRRTSPAPAPRPLVHLDALGVLGPHVLLAHAVHLDDEEVDRARRAGRRHRLLPVGLPPPRPGRHAAPAGTPSMVERGGRVALGCDAENAGDAVDVLRAAALAAGLARDTRARPDPASAPTTALELATIGGAGAVGMDHELGSLEVGKRADVVVVDATGPAWVPAAPDPVLQLVWGERRPGGPPRRGRRRVVVRDGRCTTVDVDALAGSPSSASARCSAPPGSIPGRAGRSATATERAGPLSRHCVRRPDAERRSWRVPRFALCSPHRCGQASGGWAAAPGRAGNQPGPRRRSYKGEYEYEDSSNGRGCRRCWRR